MTKITILVSAFDKKNDIQQTLNSIIRQNYVSWEVMILTDRDIVPKIEQSEKIQVINTPKLKSAIATLINYSLQVDTDLIGIISSGDELYESSLSKVINYYNSHLESCFVYTNYHLLQHDGSKTLGEAMPFQPWEDSLFVEKVGGFITFSKDGINKLEGVDKLISGAELQDFIYKFEEVTTLRMINEPLIVQKAAPLSPLKEPLRKARKAAYQRRERPDLDNWLIKLISLDFSKARKRKYKKRAQPINISIGVENLVSAKEILDSFGMKNWLTDGTLLGFYRDGSFIKHDTDLDMGAYIEEFDPKIVMEFIKHGWQVKKFFGRPDIGLEIALERNNLKLDIFFFYKDGDLLWHACWLKTKRGLNLIKYTFPQFEIIETEFLGYKFNIPKNTEDYLATKYGVNWRVPTKKWHWAFDPPNSIRTDFYLNH